MRRRWIVHPKRWRDGPWTEDDLERWIRTELRSAFKHLPFAEVYPTIPAYSAALVVTNGISKSILEGLRERIDIYPDRLVTAPPRAAFGARLQVSTPLVGQDHGKGVRVAVLDHRDVEDVATRPEQIIRYVAHESCVDPHEGEVWAGFARHATNVAYVLAGEGGTPASDAIVIGYRTEWTWRMVRAIEHIRKHRNVHLVCTAADVVDDPHHDPTNESEILDEAVRALRADGIAFVAAAGNDPEGKMKDPGRLADAITVGVFTSGCILSTPGAAPRAGRLKPTLLTPWSALSGVDGSFGLTSAATPCLASYIATWLGRNPRMSPDAIESALTACCVTPDPDQPEDKKGYGLFDPDKAENAVHESPDPNVRLPFLRAETGTARRRKRAILKPRPRLLSKLLER